MFGIAHPVYEDITDVTLARVDESQEDEDLTDAGVTVAAGADLLLDTFELHQAINNKNCLLLF